MDRPSSRPSARLIGLLVALGLAAGIRWLWPGRSGVGPGRDANPAARSASRDQVLVGAGLDPRQVPPETLARWQAIEAGVREADTTVWAPEREAERHEEGWIGWWDALRAGGDPRHVLVPEGLESVAWAEPGPGEELEAGLRRTTGRGPAGTRTAAAWSEALQAWARDGWVLDGLEWRMPRFHPASGEGQGASGGFRFEGHLAHPASGERRILRGEFTVEWHPVATPGDPPRVRRVTVDRWEALSRPGPPWFATLWREEVRPDAGSVVVDPLLVRDLDGNGFDDLVLAGKNRVYANRGGGRFEAGVLAPRLAGPLVSALLVDVDGDGRADLVGADPGGLVVVRGAGRLPLDGEPERQPLPGLQDPFVLTAGDLDGDGDVDLWLAQYKVPYRYGQMPRPYHDANDGFPAYLLRNDGQGRFTDATPGSGLEARRFRRTYSAGWVDVDDDGDLDLVNVSDFAGVDLYRNAGSGRFTDVTAANLPDPQVLGMALAVADFDRDLRPDLLAIGMNSAVAERLDQLGLVLPGFSREAAQRAPMTYGNRWWSNAGGGRFVPAPQARELAATGWSWGWRWRTSTMMATT
ncbi:MAG: FG-GAP repeat domain-containing protein, partial [Verrucomicrobiota bacterium]